MRSDDWSRWQGIWSADYKKRLVKPTTTNFRCGCYRIFSTRMEFECLKLLIEWVEGVRALPLTSQRSSSACQLSRSRQASSPPWKILWIVWWLRGWTKLIFTVTSCTTESRDWRIPREWSSVWSAATSRIRRNTLEMLDRRPKLSCSRRSSKENALNSNWWNRVTVARIANYRSFDNRSLKWSIKFVATTS